MILDGTAPPDRPADYDLVIVGAGPAGISLAVELEASGLSIALLESGGLEFDDAAQALNDGTVEGNDDEFDLGSSRLRLLGGTSNHWGGHCTPLDALDFQRAPQGFSGWPMTRENLDPFYRRAHDYLDLGRYLYDAARLAPADPSLRLLPEAPEVETRVLRQSPPTRFGEKYRARLEASANIDLWLWTNAVGFEAAADGTVAAVETRTLTGLSRRFAARAVVLAAGAIETARLLLWVNARGGTRFGDAGGFLGRCYMDHPSGGAALIRFERPVPEKLYWADIDAHADGGVPLLFVLRLSDTTLAETGLPNGHWFVAPYAVDESARAEARRARRSLNGLKAVAKWALGREVPRDFSPGREYCGFVQNADALANQGLARAFGRAGGVDQVVLKYESEQAPARDNFVRLAEETDALGMPRSVLRWAPSADDMEGVRQTALRFGALAGAAGLGRLQLEDHDADPYWGATTAWHQLGTTRMSPSETQGVVDPDARVWGTRNLYVASGGVFPTSGRANPTLTIVALALRLADHLRERLTP